MNFAHIHLIINHVPLLTIPIALIFLIYAFWRNDDGLKRFSMVILIATSVTVIPVYLTGEPAEKVVEHLPGVTEQVIAPHEEAAEFSLIVTLLAGGLAAASLILSNREKLKNWLQATLVLICFVAVVALGYTSNLGGKIRHPESSDASFAKVNQTAAQPGVKSDENEKNGGNGASEDHDND